MEVVRCQQGRSLADIARTQIGPVAGVTGAIAILFILIVALAGLGIAVVNALAESAWSVFTIGATIPIGVAMGFHMFVFRKGKIREATESVDNFEAAKKELEPKGMTVVKADVEAFRKVAEQKIWPAYKSQYSAMWDQIADFKA